LSQTPFQFLNDTNQWQKCPDDHIPDPSRTACTQCVEGEYAAQLYPELQHDERLARYHCVACPRGSYQNKRSQLKCEPKRTNCSKNYKVVYNGDDNAAHDNECHECKKSCDPGEIQIYQDNTNDTCDGNGVSYFGCMSWANPVDFPMNSRLRYTTTPNTRIPSVRVEECLLDKLPQHSYFVNVPHQPILSGRQCYFACLHGVNPNIKERVHDFEVEYAEKNDTRLQNFVVEQLTKTETQTYPGSLTIESNVPTITSQIEPDHDISLWIHESSQPLRRSCPFCTARGKKIHF